MENKTPNKIQEFSNLSDSEQNREEVKKTLLSLFCSDNDPETLNKRALADYWGSKFETYKESKNHGDYAIVAIEDRQLAFKTIVWYISCLGLNVLDFFGSTDTDGIFPDTGFIGTILKKCYPYKIEGTNQEVKDKTKAWRKVVSRDFVHIMYAQIELDRKRHDAKAHDLNLSVDEIAAHTEAKDIIRQQLNAEIRKQASIYTNDKGKKRPKKMPEIEDPSFDSCVEIDPNDTTDLIDPLIKTDTTYDDNWLTNIGLEEPNE